MLRLNEDAPRPWIIGHRGSGLDAKPQDPKPGEGADEEASNEEKELPMIGNTERAIREGIAAGVDWVELDIRATSDLEPELVVFHDEEINDKTGNVGPNPRFFMDLGDSISFQQSQRNFYSTANTKVPNDQTAFAQYLYGNMPSCKDGDGLQCLKDNPRWINY